MTDEPIRTAAPAPPAASGAAYRTIQTRVDHLLRGHAEWADIIVPACPSWTVRQTLSHLCGAAEDVAVRNLDGVATDAWTDAQVRRHEHDDIEALLAMWDAAVGQVEMLLPHAPAEPAAQLVFDAVTHEHDIRGAVGLAGVRHADPVVEIALTFITTMLDRVIAERRLPSVRLTTEHGIWQLGDPDTAPERLSLTTSSLEAIRSLGGRRSEAQVRALPWIGDPEPIFAIYIDAPIRPSVADLVE